MNFLVDNNHSEYEVFLLMSFKILLKNFNSEFSEVFTVVFFSFGSLNFRLIYATANWMESELVELMTIRNFDYHLCKLIWLNKYLSYWMKFIPPQICVLIIHLENIRSNKQKLVPNELIFVCIALDSRSDETYQKKHRRNIILLIHSFSSFFF